jgi:hypothetical protein
MGRRNTGPNFSYAPRDPKEAAQYGVKIIIADIPGPPGEFNQFLDLVPPKHTHHRSNGNKPEKEDERPKY